MTVGRNKGDIVLSEDASISRVHAHIIVKTLPNFDQITDNTQPVSKCTVKDPGSKYGNFILGDGEPTRIPDEGYDLQHLDIIRFGLQDNKFTVHYIPIITGTLGMNEHEKESLKSIIEAIDGKTTYVWSPLCTHMTVVRPTISEKLACALASGTPIVPMEYWEAVTQCFKGNKELPDPAEFASAINNKMREAGEISVVPNVARKTLFKNLTFLHFSAKQFGIYARMIRLAGGKSFQYGKPLTDIDVCADDVIVVQLVESNTTQATFTAGSNYAAVCEKLSECRRRTIPESEIPIALMHCSIVKWCNPKFDYAELFTTGGTENQPKNTTVLALDTQDLDPPPTSRQFRVINRNTVAPCIPESNQESCQIEAKPATNERQSESVNSSSADELPSESEIGSMKLASLNYEQSQREELNRKALVNANLKRVRENEISAERNKKICLEATPIDGASKPSKSDQSYEDLMPDDEDAIFMDEQVSIVEEDFEKKEAERNVVKRLSQEIEFEDFDVVEKRRPMKMVDLTVDDDVPKSMSVGASSKIKKDNSNGIFKTGGKKPFEDSASDEPEKSHKQKVGRSDISPFSDATENPRKRTKTAVAIEKQNDQPLKKSTPKKRPFTELPSPSSMSPMRNAIKEEVDWITSTTINSPDCEKDSSAISDNFGKRSSRGCNTSEFYKVPNDPNLTMLPLLRIKTTADLYMNDSTPRFGKCFRKQKITIPTRVELDVSTYDLPSVERTPKKRFSLHDDEEPSASNIVIPSIFSKAKKNFRV